MDYETQTLFWVDALEDTIESVSINGDNRKIVSSENVSITLIVSFVYYPSCPTLYSILFGQYRDCFLITTTGYQ